MKSTVPVYGPLLTYGPSIGLCRFKMPVTQAELTWPVLLKDITVGIHSDLPNLLKFVQNRFLSFISFLSHKTPQSHLP